MRLIKDLEVFKENIDVQKNIDKIKSDMNQQEELIKILQEQNVIAYFMDACKKHKEYDRGYKELYP